MSYDNIKGSKVSFNSSKTSQEAKNSSNAGVVHFTTDGKIILNKNSYGGLNEEETGTVFEEKVTPYEEIWSASLNDLRLMIVALTKRVEDLENGITTEPDDGGGEVAPPADSEMEIS